MKIVKCSCRMCRRGLRTKSRSEAVKRKIRAARRKAKLDLKLGRELDTKVAIGYTD